MPHRIINTPHDLQALGRTLGALKLPITVTWRQGRDRSLDQNHLQFLWAREFSEVMGDRTLDEVRCDWKLRHGVPILRAEDDKFRQTYDAVLKPRTFEEKLAVMQYLPVTSLMTVPQMTAYLDAVQRECLQMGVRLTDPDKNA
jgi:hypothetical protein